MKKVKKSNLVFRTLLILAMVLVLVLDIVATAAMLYFEPMLNMFFGQPERIVTNPAGTENWVLDYYEPETLYDMSAAKQASLQVSKQISDEGIVLLKNKDGALPLDGEDSVTPFGRSFADPIYGGSGSGATATNADILITPYKAFSTGFANFNQTMYDQIQKILDSGEYYRGVVSGRNSTYEIGEFPLDAYGDVLSSTAGSDVGVVIISRIGGEGADLARDMVPYGGNAGEHQLELNDEEKAILEQAKNSCDKVVVVINAATSFELGALELDENVDAIVWMAFPGEVGFASLVDVLLGKVNPSGRTIDTFAADFTKDPTWQNMGDYSYNSENMAGQTIGMGVDSILFVPASGEYIEYEEGIYMGYRYYETAAVELGEDWYQEWRTSFDESSYTTPGTGVVYPFGYGLSYTTFTQELISSAVVDGQINATVQVTNTGNVAGKDVVQLYYTAPYTSGGIEKAHVVLGAFDKTEMLQPGESEILELSFAVEDMASYDTYGYGCYVLESGEYTIRLMHNSHEEIDSFVYVQAETEVFDSANPRQSEVDAQSVMNEDGTLEQTPAKSLTDSTAAYVSAVNRFEYVNDYMASGEVTNMSRADFLGTFPTEPPAEKTATDEFAALWDSFDYNTDPELGNVEGSEIYQAEAPAQGEYNGIVLADLRGLNYYDPLWEDFLDQIVYDNDTLKVMVGGNYITSPVDYLGLPGTSSHDGPVGLTGVYGTGQTIDACSWCSTTLLAASFNTDLALAMGECFGEECLATGTTGWYGPGLNIHRSPFSGRNFEYYSEDPLVTGKMAAQVVSGAGNKGVSCYLKHFALNDQEVNRYNQTAAFATEQTMREIYLRGFEICIKEATCTLKYISDDDGTVSSQVRRAATAVMTAHYRIGLDHSSECYGLLTEILRDEWGFTGTTLTDMMDGVNYDRRMRAGLSISMDAKSWLSMEDLSSPTAQWAARERLHEICYTIVNSNAMNFTAPGAQTTQKVEGWRIGLITANVLVVALVGLSIYWMIWRTKDAKLHPERYAGTPEGNAAKAAYKADPVVKRRKRIKWIVILIVLAILAVVAIGAFLDWFALLTI